jgi:ABC-type multidrug transport system permease subunit
MNPQPENGFTSMATTLGPVWIMIAIAAIFWIYSLVDVMRSDFKDPGDKTRWLLLLIFLAPLGTILYLIIGRSKKSHQKS